MTTPYQRLIECTDYDAVDSILDDIGFVSGATEKRLLYLYHVMGIKKVYTAEDCDMQERYNIAKEELTSQAWKD